MIQPIILNYDTAVIWTHLVYDAGAYAYWLGSGISTDHDQEMVENCIRLFCTENLSEQ